MKASKLSPLVKGFTLLELFVAIAVFLIVASTLVSIAAFSSNIWLQGIAHNDRRAAAMAVFGQMSQDLRNASQPTDLSAPKLQMVINPADGGPPLSGNYKFPQAIFWQAPVAASGGKGDLAVIGYFVQWITNDTGVASAKLCRLYIDPSAAEYTVYSSGTSSWSSSITDALVSGTNGAPANRATGYQGQLAKNVLGLWVQPLDQSGKPITKYPIYSDSSPITVSSGKFAPGQFDSAKGYISSALYTTGTGSSGTTPMSYPGAFAFSNALIPPSAGNGSLPAAIEVAIVIVDSRTAVKLSGTERPGSSTGDLWADVNTFYNSLSPVIRQGAEIHSTIIGLNAASR